MSSLQKEKETFRFVVTSQDGVFEIDDEYDLEMFSLKLSGIQYSSQETDISWEGTAHEVVVFSTAFDAGLSHYIASHPAVSFRVFRTKRGKGKAVRRISFFQEFDPTLLPGPWIFRSQKPDAKSVNAAVISEEKLKIYL